MQVGETDDLKEALGAYPDSFDSDHYIITHIRNQRTGWDLIHVIENAKLVSDGLTIPLITTIVILILILFSVFFSILAANTITRPLKPVSYTHLDVYKRQVPDRAGGDDVQRLLAACYLDRPRG